MKKFSVNNRKKIIYTTMAVAASCLVFFSIINKHSDNITKESIYTEYFKPADAGIVFRSSDDNAINIELKSAMSMYENKQYREAISVFENILNRDSSRIGLNLYSGISHMEIEEYEEANKNFNRILDHKANAFIESAQWYLGLCYLMTDNSEKAKGVFEDIAGSTSYYKKDAKKLLKKMNR